MKRKMISLVLVMAMMLSAFPPVLSVRAAEKSMAWEVDNAIKNEYGTVFFETFDDLKELASRTYPASTFGESAHYIGEEELVIEENLTLPAYLTVSVDKIRIPKDVRLITENNGKIDAKIATIEGTLDMRGTMEISEQLNVTGLLILEEGMLFLRGFDVTVIGYGNIDTEKPGIVHSPYIHQNGIIMSLEELREIANRANIHTNTEFSITYWVEEETILDESLIIPENCDIYIQTAKTKFSESESTFTIAKDATLTLRGDIRIHIPVIIEGTFRVNKGYWGNTFHLEYENTGKAGRLIKTDTGTFESDVSIQVFCENLDELNSALEGFDLSEYTIAEVTDYSHYYVIDKNMATIKDVMWHPYLPGVAQFTIVDPVGVLTFEVYREDEFFPCYTSRVSYDITMRPDFKIWTINSFARETDPESGTYYFKLTPRGDGGGRGDPLVSDKWTYVRPDIQIDKVMNVKWEGKKVKFTVPEDISNVHGYWVDLYRAEEKGDTPYRFIDTGMYAESGEYDFSRSFAYFPEGYYYVKVRALSSDITVARNSEWSEFSDVLYHNPDGHTHSFGEWTTIKKADCETAGEKQRSCSCGEVEKESIPSTGHTEVIDAAVAATCTTPGKTEGKHCSVCGEVLADQTEVAAPGHKFSDGICTVCGDKDPDYVKPTEPEPTEPEPTEPEEPPVDRIAGTNRISTALTTSDKLKEVMGVEKYDTIVVADAMSFPDALSGSYLAAATKAPILLYKEGQASVVKYVRENLKSGGKVYVLGGTASVPESLLAELSGIDCERVAGSGRLATSLLIIAKADELRGTKPDKVLICDGRGFADSLSASATGLPILLVNGGGSLNTDQKAYLESVRGAELYVIGGKASVSEEILAALDAYDANGAERVAGNGRELTSVEVAKKFFPEAKRAALASSLDFPDGLSGGPVAYAMNMPLLLTREAKINVTGDYVNSRGITSGYIIGGESAVPDAIASKIFAK